MNTLAEPLIPHPFIVIKPPLPFTIYLSPGYQLLPLLRIVVVESHSHSTVTPPLPEPSLPIAPSASQTLQIPQQLQQSIAREIAL